MQVNDLPTVCLLLQNKGPAIQESKAIVQVECRNRDVPGKLEMQIAGLDVHVGAFCPAGPNTLEDFPEPFFQFCAACCATREFPGIEDGRVIRK